MLHVTQKRVACNKRSKHAMLRHKTPHQAMWTQASRLYTTKNNRKKKDVMYNVIYTDNTSSYGWMNGIKRHVLVEGLNKTKNHNKSMLLTTSCVTLAMALAESMWYDCSTILTLGTLFDFLTTSLTSSLPAIGAGCWEGVYRSFERRKSFMKKSLEVGA